jgi:tRNA pseudouridine13 synthase
LAKAKRSTRSSRPQTEIASPIPANPIPINPIPTWARAHGEPIFDARIRGVPADFIVTENIDFELTGDGEHDFLWIEKNGANTAWVARQLAAHAGVAAKDVGYAGLKDRHAITSQWFSVRRPTGEGTDWSAFEAEGVRIVEITRHNKKLRRGAHRSNSFRIALRSAEIDGLRDEIKKRLRLIEENGVPNYFGEQRFGRDGGNIALADAVFAGRRVKRDKRSIAISSARSLLFNHILQTRVRTGTWNQLQAGDLANLDGSGSVFAVEELTPDLMNRCEASDIHPTGTLWGDGAPLTTGDVASAELEAVAGYESLTEGLDSARVEASSRALRLPVRDFSAEFGDDVLWLSFSLPKGGFATVVLREIATKLLAR